MPIQRICVFGAGAVGGFLAARLAFAGRTVSVVARGAHLDAIRAHGLRLATPEDTRAVRVEATDDPATLGAQDLVVTAVKAHALPAAAALMVPLLGDETPVVYAVNGIPWWYGHGGGADADFRFDRLDPDGALRDTVGVARTIGCVVHSPNEVIEPGTIRNVARSNRFVLGEIDGAMTPRIEAVAAVFRAAGLGADVSADIRREVWAKLVTNVTSSPLTALTGTSPARLTAEPELTAVFAALAREMEAIAAAAGIAVAADVARRLDHIRHSQHRTSMLQDLSAGRPMEIDAILSVVQDMARAKQVATPCLDLLTALIKERARVLGLYS